MGQNIWGRPKSPVNKREYGPGQHGQRRKGKMSDFGTQLRAKQKLKGYYGNISESQFRNIYSEAIRRKRRHLGEPDRPARAPARRGDLPRQVRADRVRRAPVRQPRPCEGQRQAGQHRLLPLKAGDVIELKDSSKQLALVLEATPARRARRAGLYRRRPRQDDREVRAHPGARRRALSGADGTAPLRRVLLALNRSRPVSARARAGLPSHPPWTRCASRAPFDGGRMETLLCLTNPCSAKSTRRSARTRRKPSGRNTETSSPPSPSASCSPSPRSRDGSIGS